MDEFKYVTFQIPISCIKKTFNVNNISPVENMKTDSLIHRIYKSSDVESICFDITREELIKSVLGYNLYPPSETATPSCKTTLVEFR